MLCDARVSLNGKVVSCKIYLILIRNWRVDPDLRKVMGCCEDVDFGEARYVYIRENFGLSSSPYVTCYI
jgi:hypothetical protein